MKQNKLGTQYHAKVHLIVIEITTLIMDTNVMQTIAVFHHMVIQMLTAMEHGRKMGPGSGTTLLIVVTLT